MIILKNECQAPSFDPMQASLAPTKHQPGLELRVGEMVILMDYYPDAKPRTGMLLKSAKSYTSDRFTVNGYITK